MSTDIEFPSRLPKLLAEKQRRIDRAYGEDRLYNFVQQMWPVLEPKKPFIKGWVPEAICEHLEAVTYGDIQNLLMNLPTGFSKSMLLSVMWPAWEWGPCNAPHLRYLMFSYAEELSLRDNGYCRDLIVSPEYQRLYGDRFTLVGDKNAKHFYATSARGWRYASSTGARTTGFRGNRVIIDDGHNIKDGESKVKREAAVIWLRESAMTRVNDHKEDSIIVCMQRVHESDMTGAILEDDLGFVHLCIPMHYDSKRHCVTSIGWQDPRGIDDYGEPLDGAALDKAEGTLAWPERIQGKELSDLEKKMGPYAVASQLEQRPTPRGGAIFAREDWQPWPPIDWWDKWEREGKDLADISRRLGRFNGPKYPPFEMVVASLDTAHTEKRENDYSALTIWGIWRGQEMRTIPTAADAIDESRWSVMPEEEVPKLMLIHGWQKRLLLHGPPMKLPEGVTMRDWQQAMRRTYHPGEFQAPATGGERIAADYIRSGQHKTQWGLTEWVADDCRRYRVEQLLIEASAAGFAVSSELKRLYADLPFAVNLVPTGSLDKVARAHSVQHMFANKQVYVLMDHEGLAKDWAQVIIDQMATFPKSAHDDLCDSSVQAVRWLRDRNWLLRTEEAEAEWAEQMRYKPKPKKLYDL